MIPWIVGYIILGIVTGIAIVRFLLLDELMDNDWVPSRSDMNLLVIGVFFWPLAWAVGLAWFLCYLIIALCKWTTR